MRQKLTHILFFALATSLSAFGQKVYYKPHDGEIIDSSAYINRKNQQIVKLEAIKKPVFVDEKLKEIKRTNDSLIYEYALSFALGKKPKNQPKEFESADYLNKEFPLEKMQTLTGEEIDINKLKGKPTLINFWFTTCAPCIEEIPILNALKEKYGESVNFISMVADSEMKTKKFLTKREYNFTHIVNKKYITDVLSIHGMPINIFLDKEGKVVDVKGNVAYVRSEKGYVMGDGNDFELMIKKLIQ